MAINRFSLFFLPFTFAFLVFTNSNLTAMTPTLEKLNACYLSPASPGINVPRTYMNITNLFKKINRQNAIYLHGSYTQQLSQ